MSMDHLIRQEARLIILRAIAQQTDETLNSSLLVEELKTFGISRPRAWVHQEMEYLREMGALTVREASTVVIGTLTEQGRRHLDREIIIEGVKRPSRAEA